MKRKFLLAVFFLVPGMLFANQLEFQTPTYEKPYFRMLLSLTIEKNNSLINELLVNGKNWDSFLAFKEGKIVDIYSPLDKGTYNILIDYAWKNHKPYEITLSYQLEDLAKTKIAKIKGKSPKTGGIPQAEEGFYRIFRAQETIGLARENEISTLTLTSAKKDTENQDFIIFDLDKGSPIEYQILGTEESIPQEKVLKNYAATLTYKIAFLLDIASYEKKLILCLKGEGKPSKIKGFDINGEGIGKTVKGKELSLEFHPQSGQINIIECVKSGIRLHNHAGVIHWNPGVFIPGIAWDHSYNWNPPPNFEEMFGKFLYINSRRGPFQKIKDVILEIKYTLEADSPYFLSETRMTVKKDLGVIAVRNDEMVLSKELFDSLIYKDKRNKIIKIPLKEKPGYPYGLVHIAPDDLDWIGLLNTEKNYGFFSLRINSANSALSPSGSWLHKPGTYFYAPSHGKYVYWVRPLLYTWSEYMTNKLLTFVPEGSSFYEKNAYIVLPLEKHFAKKLDTLLKKLKNPVRIY